MSKTHIACGLLTGLVISKVTSNYSFDYYYLVPGLILGSTTPDLDTEKSWAAQTIPFVDDLLRKTKILKHRGLTHGITGIIFAVILYFLIKNQFTLGFGVGYISHCLLDMLCSKIKVTTKHDNAVYKLTWTLIVIISFIKF
jgi:membrane-bound metal-dependent hydrolase YbcI (DUF457 family)